MCVDVAPLAALPCSRRRGGLWVGGGFGAPIGACSMLGGGPYGRRHEGGGENGRTRLHSCCIRCGLGACIFFNPVGLRSIDTATGYLSPKPIDKCWYPRNPKREHLTNRSPCCMQISGMASECGVSGRRLRLLLTSLIWLDLGRGACVGGGYCTRGTYASSCRQQRNLYTTAKGKARCHS